MKIFCINTGRSGSHYLHVLFSMAEGVASFHEPYPNMQGKAYVDYNTARPEAFEDQWKVKLAKINQHELYAETNNAFIKGFCDMAVRDIQDIAVVWLRRNREHIIDSLHASGYFKNPVNIHGEWLLRPFFTTNITSYAGGDPAAWYVDEVEARAERFKRHHDVYEVWLEDLNRLGNVKKMFDHFGLKPKPHLDKVVGKPTNTR